MIYDQHNCQGGTLVFDVDRKLRIDRVLSIDTESGEVFCGHDPYRFVDGEVARYAIKFRSVYPIFGLDQWPGLFHCYGLESV